MTQLLHRAGQTLAILSLVGLATSADAQRTRQGTAKTHKTTTVNKAGHANRGTRNTNVNVNKTVNVNRDVDVHVWGGPRVRAARYAWPPGYAYGRRAVGYILPGPFLTSAYYYTGYTKLGLPPPPGGQQWVRYGEDLLLVQVGTGEVVDVRYGVFD
jgi:Ni/Co efflux regulator RcnB